MSPFWAALFEELRERGRNATLFIVALAALCGLLIISAVAASILRSEFRLMAEIILASAGVLLAAFGIRALCRAFLRSRGRSSISRLSSDELTKARSKLLRDRNRSSV